MSDATWSCEACGGTRFYAAPGVVADLVQLSAMPEAWCMNCGVHDVPQPIIDKTTRPLATLQQRRPWCGLGRIQQAVCRCIPVKGQQKQALRDRASGITADMFERMLVSLEARGEIDGNAPPDDPTLEAIDDRHSYAQTKAQLEWLDRNAPEAISACIILDNARPRSV